MLVAARQGVFGSNQVGGGETVRSCSRESERARDVGVRESWYLKNKVSGGKGGLSRCN